VEESAAGPVGTDAGVPTVDADRDYLRRVRAEIDEEVRRRRASGDLPPQLEIELDELFLRHAPLGSTRQELHEVVRLVDAAAFIDPVVPVESNHSGGALVKRSIRTLNFWYLRFITHQVSQFATSVSRALHLVDQQLSELADKVEAVELPPSVVIDVADAHHADAWWVPALRGDISGMRRRVVHAACGDGWLVAALIAAGVDAYGVDPRPGRVTEQELGDLDLREEPVLDHLRAVAVGSLDGVVLTGLMEGSYAGERGRLLEAAASALAPGGVLAVHSLSPSGWDAADAPPEADIAGTRPYRPGTWPAVLRDLGLDATVTPGPGADPRDYLVLARRPADGPAPR
jgi:SAM-dependent methyltransferase